MVLVSHNAPYQQPHVDSLPDTPRYTVETGNKCVPPEDQGGHGARDDGDDDDEDGDDEHVFVPRGPSRRPTRPETHKTETRPTRPGKSTKPT